MADQSAWSLDSVIYHIYPRSFMDGNGDGIGDLQGIISKADYLANLGVNSIWISPIYPSPQVDFGYDISDFCDIDPMYGTLSDFDELIDVFHKKGIKVLMDYVPNHTSSQHSWFVESRSSKDDPKRDWYIWRDGKNNQPPNNWFSNFGGSAWTLDEKTGQYYYHAFDKEQPDLNWRNPHVVKAMFDIIHFWMNRGVDGFRVDAVYYLFEDPQFRDEPKDPEWQPGQHDHDSLQHIYTLALPETLQMVKEISDVINEYKNAFMVTETYTNIRLENLKTMYESIGQKTTLPFNFSFIKFPWKAEIHKAFIDVYDKIVGEEYFTTYVLGNHDKPRVGTRIGVDQARVAAIALFTLRGIPFIYYGEEIGMVNTPLPKEKRRDNYDRNAPGQSLGRFPARTPMQWTASKNAGFSTSSETWLPINDNYTTTNVASEEQDPKSFLSLYKLLIKLRKQHTALREGTYTPLPSPADNVFAFLRETVQEKILILLNFDDKDKHLTMAYKGTILINAAMDFQEEEKINLSDLTLAGSQGYIILLQ